MKKRNEEEITRAISKVFGQPAALLNRETGKVYRVIGWGVSKKNVVWQGCDPEGWLALDEGVQHYIVVHGIADHGARRLVVTTDDLSKGYYVPLYYKEDRKIEAVVYEICFEFEI